VTQQDAVVDAARSKIGDSYGWGAEGPTVFDCSGLTQWAYAQIGVSIPRTSQEQAVAGVPVAYSDLQLGDLIIIYPDASHVAMYSGNGNVIQAADYGIPVEEVPIIQAGPYNTARRFLT
jgi:cell wall-associated NlpC family hydrolase